MFVVFDSHMLAQGGGSIVNITAYAGNVWRVQHHMTQQNGGGRIQNRWRRIWFA